MAYIYMDESGDLGFNPKKKNSKYFVITFLFVNNTRPLEKVIRKVHASLKKRIKKKVSVLHATKESHITRKKLLKEMATKDCAIMVIFLNKSKVYSNLREEKAVLYNYVVNILLDRIFTKALLDTKDVIEFVASRRETNKFLNENFKRYLETEVLNNHKKKINIKIVPPHKDKLLQAVDFASWAVFRKYERDDNTYYNYIEDMIVEEKGLFN